MADADWRSALEGLRDRIDQTLQLLTRHAAGELDADAWAAACADLAQAFLAVRPMIQSHAPAHRPADVAILLADIGQRLQTLNDLQARLSGASRHALAQLLPQDDLQAYTRLGRQHPGRTGVGGYG
ncbi:MAG: hypothetical protein P3W97_003905 [Tepidimonas sp.]|uniref:hypothetical protein n=1 Tax=Tepidimonas sp. TaxID=2002775 RepID=UPI00259E3C66|nr:hypothetical protein [Tepidimonas sp.]MDM7456402.1 hypothetical protein [Tepidimonas sp.]